MKKNEIKALHQKSVADLKKIKSEIEAEIVKLQKEMSEKKLKNVSLIKYKFDDLARVLTVLSLKMNNE